MTFVQQWRIPVIKISALSNVVYWSYCPKPTKTGPTGSWTKKKQLLLLGKVENGKYPEAETWHPESIDRRSDYRRCENFWWPFDIAPWGQFRPNLGPYFFFFFFFLLNFTRILWFFWDLGLTLFDIPTDAAFAEILIFRKIFGFPAVNGAPKWTKTVTFQWIPFEPNFKILKDFSNNIFVLLDYL